MASSSAIAGLTRLLLVLFAGGLMAGGRTEDRGLQHIRRVSTVLLVPSSYVIGCEEMEAPARGLRNTGKLLLLDGSRSNG